MIVGGATLDGYRRQVRSDDNNKTAAQLATDRAEFEAKRSEDIQKGNALRDKNMQTEVSFVNHRAESDAYDKACNAHDKNPSEYTKYEKDKAKKSWFNLLKNYPLRHP